MSTETEIKIELADYPTYLKIYSALGIPAQHLLQKNFYFDTVDRLLHRKGVMFRLRVENNKNTFTVKSNATIKDGVQEAYEREKNVLDIDLSVENLNKILTELCNIELPSFLALSELGSITNNRAVFENFFGVKLELDHMQIFEQHFYEIEIETNEVAFHLEKIKELLNQNHIEFKPSCSKYGRFLKMLNKI